MTPESFARAKGIFLDALERPAAERPAFVADSCAGDAEIRQEVEALLETEEKAAGCLHGLLPEEAKVSGGLGGDAPPAGMPARVGPYTIVREIGQGGMGAVYLAERADREYRGSVALKIVPRGMDTDFILQRFRSERQILASLSHPNIARLLDGGTTDDGRPYFAMEYIEGEHLTAWCRTRALALPDRITLFRTVCEAVQYAHRNLVVHRDIKPSNILVTPDGVPKLLDFGLAKLLDRSDSPDSSYRTVAGMGAFTPEYASPEQVRLENITTASDIYSLGIVLYELLTGEHPYRRKDMSPTQVLTAVCELQPTLPSRAAAAGLRASEKKQARRLAGDLDTIVMMAIRKEPGRRYASAEQLSEDLRRYLAGLPVLARKDTLPYRAGKFARRHRLAVAAAAVVAASLVAGASTALWQAGRARASEAIARRRFEDVRALAKTVLFDLHDQIETLPGSTKARATLVSTSLRYLDSLAKEAGPDPALAREVAAGYARLADIQGGANTNLGDREGALRSRRAAIALLEGLTASRDAAPEDLESLAAQLNAVAYLLESSNPDTSAALARALQICTALFEKDPSSPAFQRGLARSLDASAKYHRERKEFAEALALQRREHEIFAGIAAGPGATASDRRNLALSDKMLGALLHQTGDLAGARPLYQQAVALDEARVAEDPLSSLARLDLSFSVGSLGSLAVDSGDLPLGRALYTRALELRQEVASSDPANAWARGAVARAHERLADIEQRLGHPKAAEEHRLKGRLPAPSGR